MPPSTQHVHPTYCTIEIFTQNLHHHAHLGERAKATLRVAEASEATCSTVPGMAQAGVAAQQG